MIEFEIGDTVCEFDYLHNKPGFDKGFVVYCDFDNISLIKTNIKTVINSYNRIYFLSSVVLLEKHKPRLEDRIVVF